MKVIGKNEQEILSWEKDWERPLGKTHWAEGRSAMEIARAFFREGRARLPDPLRKLLATEPRLKGFVADKAYPEKRTPLPPEGSSGPRNHDVWLVGRVGAEKVSIGIEAKADESFDLPLARKVTKASTR